MSQGLKLIVGLGNPGKEYANTRHNVGFMVLRRFAESQSLIFKNEKKFTAEICILEKQLQRASTTSKENDKTTKLDQKIKVVIALPTTYMNESGTAVAKIVKFYKIKSEDILVVHDDVSIDFGKTKMSFNRGGGGHHGVEDIIDKLGNTKNFHRLRVGVGPDPGGDLRADYVLAKFPEEERKQLEQIIDIGVKALRDWVS